MEAPCNNALDEFPSRRKPEPAEITVNVRILNRVHVKVKRFAQADWSVGRDALLAHISVLKSMYASARLPE